MNTGFERRILGRMIKIGKITFRLLWFAVCAAGGTVLIMAGLERFQTVVGMLLLPVVIAWVGVYFVGDSLLLKVLAVAEVLLVPDVPRKDALVWAAANYGDERAEKVRFYLRRLLAVLLRSRFWEALQTTEPTADRNYQFRAQYASCLHCTSE